MSVPVGAIIGASTKIAEYFGLIEGVDTKVTKLLHQAFLSAKDNLQYARNVEGQNQRDYIVQAKNEFIRAVAVEENENKILALVGLSMCQYLIGEVQNAKSTLSRINNVELTRSEVAKYFAADASIFSPIGSLARLALPFNSLEERRLYFETIKHISVSTNHNLLN